MQCKIDDKGFCQNHGIQMDAAFASMPGSLCAIGYIAAVEERFQYTAKEAEASLQAVHSRLNLIDERLSAIEDKLGLENPLFKDDA